MWRIGRDLFLAHFPDMVNHRSVRRLRPVNFPGTSHTVTFVPYETPRLVSIGVGPVRG